MSHRHLGVSERPPHLPKPKEVLGILGCSYPPQRCSVGVREHRDPEGGPGADVLLGSGPAHATPSKAFVPPLCSWLQTQGTQHPP